MGILYRQFPSNFVTRTVDKFIRWNRKNDLAIFPILEKCCQIDFHWLQYLLLMDRRNDLKIVSSFRKADVILISGGLTYGLLDYLFKKIELIPEPYYVILNTGCLHNFNDDEENMISRLKNKTDNLFIIDACPISLTDIYKAVDEIKLSVEKEHHIVQN